MPRKMRLAEQRLRKKLAAEFLRCARTYSRGRKDLNEVGIALLDGAVEAYENAAEHCLRGVPVEPEPEPPKEEAT